MNTRKSLNALADQVIDRLKDHVTIHRYDSFSTNSIYLKFDYGVANSLRISDHPGKKHLKYRFNLMSEQTEPHYTIMYEKFPMHFYPPKEMDELIDAILQGKTEKENSYNNYHAVVAHAQKVINPDIGFWKQAKKIN